MTRVWERRGSDPDVVVATTRGGTYFCANLHGSTIYVGAPSTWEQRLRGSSIFAGAASTQQRR